MRRLTKIGLELLALMSALTFAPGMARAATITYTGNAFYADEACPDEPIGDPTDWNDGRNWGTHCGGGPIPGPNDTVIMGRDSRGEPAQIAPPNVTVTNLTLKDDASLIGTGSLTVTGTLNWTESGVAGTIESNITISPGGVFTIAGDAPRSLAGSALTNHGALTWSGGNIELRTDNANANDATQIFNFGTFRITANGGSISDEAHMGSAGSGDPGARVFSNSGLLEINPGAGQTVFLDNIKFSNSGEVDVKSGAVNIAASSSGTHSGMFQTATGTTFSLNSGTQLQTFASTARFAGPGQSILENLTLRGTITAGNITAGSPGNLLLTGSLNAPNGITLRTLGAGVMDVGSAGGTALSGGTWTIPAGTTVNFIDDSTGQMSFGATQLVNQGTLNVRKVGFHFTGDNTTFNNSGTLNIEMDNDRTIGRGGLEGTTTLTNTGIINKNNTNSNEIRGLIKVVNTGTINANAGILRLIGSAVVSSLSGTINNSAGASLDLVGDETELKDTVINGPGRVRLIGGTLLRLVGTVTANGTNSCEIASGWLTGAAGSKMAGTGWLWTGGTLGGLGRITGTPVATTITLDNGAIMNINGTASKDFNGDASSTGPGAVTFVNNGTINWNQGNLSASGTVAFNNIGTFNAFSNTTMEGQFRNSGILNIGNAVNARRLTHNGPFTQTSTGRINFKIGGTTAGSQFDQLVVNHNNLTLNGAVGVTMLNNYNPPVGTNFLLIDHTNFDPTVGTFSGLPQGGTLVASNQAFIADYTDGFELRNLPLLSISGPAAAITEGDSNSVNATFTVTLNKASTQQITVNYATVSGTATANSDFTTTNGTLTFAAGQTIKSVTVPVLGDLLDEENEQFSLRLSSAVNAVAPANVAASATITDGDDTPSLTVSSPRAFLEGSAAAPGSTTFGIRLSAPSGKTITVNYQTADGLVNGAVAGQDYVAASGSVTFTPGQTLKTVTVPFIGEAIAELNEQFFLDIKTPTNATITSSRGKAFIGNDDGPSISIDNATSVQEGNSGTKGQNFVVKLSAASTNTITVNWATGNGTATGGAGPADFTVATGTLSFAPGETQKTITIQVKGDTTVEPTEKYFVNLTRPTFAIIADSQGSGFIINDDTAPGIAAADQPSK